MERADDWGSFLEQAERVFILARRAGDAASCGKVLFESESLSGDSATERGEGKVVAALTARGVGTCGADEQWLPLVADPLKARDAKGVSSDVEAGHLIPVVSVFTPSRRNGVEESVGIAPTLQSFMGTGGNNVPFVNQTPVLLTMRAGKPGGGKGALLSVDQSLTLATGNNQTLIYEGVRRLTPTEVERLQGFPDGWTKYRMENGKVVEQADSSRYKQMGNAVAVPVVEWIAKRIKEMA